MKSRPTRFTSLELDALLSHLVMRYLPRIQIEGDCWALPLKGSRGYSQISWPGSGMRRPRTIRSHRAFYMAFHGRDTGDLELDHLCRNRGCVRPSHLEPVTGAVNLSRSGPAVAATCKRGHPYTGARDRRGRRHCRECKKIKYCGPERAERRRARSLAEWRRRYRAALDNYAVPAGIFIGDLQDNRRVRDDGRRRCVICNKPAEGEIVLHIGSDNLTTCEPGSGTAYPIGGDCLRRVEALSAALDAASERSEGK